MRRAENSSSMTLSIFCSGSLAIGTNFRHTKPAHRAHSHLHQEDCDISWFRTFEASERGADKSPLCSLQEYGSLTLPRAQMSWFWHHKDHLIFVIWNTSSNTVMGTLSWCSVLVKILPCVAETIFLLRCQRFRLRNTFSIYILYTLESAKARADS